MNNPLVVITGVGEATGRALVDRFTRVGHPVAMLARDEARLRSYEQEFPAAKAYPCDIGDLQALQAVISRIQAEMGPVGILVHNAVAHSFETFLEADPESLERNFRVNTTALLYLARAVAPGMIATGEGAIICTGNTASHRGVPTYALFAPTKAAQRIFCEALARDLGPKGIHVGYVTVDAAIDVAWLGADEDRPDWLVPPADWPHSREEFFAKPGAIAEEVYHLTQQDRTTWTFDLVIRPFAEKW